MKWRGVVLLAFAASLIALDHSAERALAAGPGQVATATAGNAPVPLTNETISHFESAFGTISAAAQVTIAAEGVPFQQSLTPTGASALISSVSGSDVDLDEEVTLIAIAYDYDVERTSRRCFLLRKRHSDANDLPDVTYAEIVHCLQAVLGTIDSFVPAQSDISQQNPVFALYDSLTQEQLARAQDGISLSELDPTQRKLALSTANQSVSSRLTDHLKWALNELLALQDDRTVFTWLSKSGLGFEGPLGPKGSLWQVPLSTSYRMQTGSYRPSNLPPGHSGDSTPPTELDRRLAAGMLSNRLPSTLTLGEFARSIIGETESGLTLSGDPAVEGKPICLFGASFTGKGTLIRDIAALYGLRVETPDNHNIALSLPRRGAIRDPQDVSAELARLIPPSLLRYESWHPLFDARRTSAPTEEPSTPRAKRISIAEADHNAKYIWAGVVTADSYYAPAVKRLRVLAEPAVPTIDSPPVSVKALGPEPARLIALMALAGQGMVELGRLRDYAPPICLFNPDTMVIQISSRSNQAGNSVGRLVSASFGYRDENGKFEGEFGSNVFAPAAK